MAANQGAAPIIIKKIKKGGHGHHGGAWKVAFADFVTAMMAFFMLMWLMSSTTVEERAAISSYFNDPLATTGYSGNGAGNPALNGGEGILSGRGENPFTSQSTNKDNTTTNGPAEEEDADKLDKARMIKMMDELKAVVDAGKGLKDYADQVLFDITPEGLRIQIVDKENRAMFDQGSAHLKSYTADILHEIVKVISEAPNRVSISGHTDATPYAYDGDYGNWELSADRANAARRELLNGGLPEDKVGRVVGLGSSDLLDPSQPQAPINRRISIVVLRGDFGKAVSMDGAESDGSANGDAAAASGDAAAPAVEAPQEAGDAAPADAKAAAPAAETAPAAPAATAEPARKSTGVAPSVGAAAADAVAAAAALSAPAAKATAAKAAPVKVAAAKVAPPAKAKPRQ
ncbi:MAG: flagellar motor protein MotB [Gammaproteobacteria bacterium]|nr:flagellar motor protein MotB [Gammaproteobacteria bacterium]